MSVIPAKAHCCPGKFLVGFKTVTKPPNASISPAVIPAKAGIHFALMQKQDGLTSFAVEKRLRFRGNDVKQKWGVALKSSHLPSRSDES